ncbi:unnamed protein product [Lampetra planeri]
MTRNAPDPRRMSESEQGRAWVALGDRHAQTGWCRACGGLVAGSRGRCGNASPVAMHFDASAFTERRYSAARGGEESPPSIQQWTAAAAGPCGVAPVYPTPGLSRQRLLGGPEFPGLAWNERTSGRAAHLLPIHQQLPGRIASCYNSSAAFRPAPRCRSDAAFRLLAPRVASGCANLFWCVQTWFCVRV